MDAPDFCRWLQGHCELQEGNKPPSDKQWLLIKQHLQLVFFKVTDDIELISETHNTALEKMLEGYDKELIEHGNTQKKAGPFCKPAPSNNICSSTDQ